ncbi:MAG: Hsp20/alpha crystallin family protein [Bacteroidales bacterium]
MALVKRNENLWPWFPSLIDNLFSRDLMDWSNLNFSATNTTLPAVNIRETKDDFLIEVAAPGMDKKDFKINLENDQLVISSERKEENEEKDDNYTRREFSYQSFTRTFSLPENLVDADKISAKYVDGILKIQVPKKEEAKPKPARTIKIS